MRLLPAFAALLGVVGTASALQVDRTAAPREGLYDTDPGHLWNQLHQILRVRTAPDGSEHGFDAVDPLLWRETKYLLTGPSHARAIKVLDRFLASHGERLVRDRLKRAVFQHDLWAVFDWLATLRDRDSAARNALMWRVADVMRRVALPRKDIETLPDTYEAAVASGTIVDRRGAPRQRLALPSDLFDPAGPWVGIGGDQPTAAHHAVELGRSAFIVLWNVPGGAARTLEYLHSLWSFPQPFVPDGSFQFAKDGEVRATLNPALPPVPDGTQIALVRKMLLIDDAGVIVPSNIVESIQLRSFPGRAFAEVRFSRAALFAGKAGGLRTVGPDDRDFITFSAHGMDPFEFPGSRGSVETIRVLDGCANCHQIDSQPATHTILSLREVLKPRRLVDPRHERWSRWFTQPMVAAGAKSRTYEWGVLQGLWQSQGR